MHQSQIPYLKNHNINKYFNRLSEKLIEYNLGSHSILVVGGAAVALKNKYFGRATVDIDICLKSQNRLYDCCMLVASEFKLPSDWINADVMHSDSFSYRLFENAELYKVYNGVLNVYIVSDLDLFCMKLVSFRQKDINDLEKLVKRLKRSKISYNDVIDEFIFLYGSLYLLKNTQKVYLAQVFK